MISNNERATKRDFPFKAFWTYYSHESLKTVVLIILFLLFMDYGSDRTLPIAGHLVTGFILFIAIMVPRIHKHYHSIKSLGLQEVSADDLESTQMRIFQSSLSKEEILERLQNDFFTSQMKLITKGHKIKLLPNTKLSYNREKIYIDIMDCDGGHKAIHLTCLNPQHFLDPGGSLVRVLHLKNILQ